MNLVSSKVLTGIIVLVVDCGVALTATLLLYFKYKRCENRESTFLDVLYTLSGGIIFGLFFLSISPQISVHFSSVIHSCALASFVSSLAPLLWMLFMWLVEEIVRTVSHILERHQSVGETTPLSQQMDEVSNNEKEEEMKKTKTSVHSSLMIFFLTVALGLHAFFEGMGVGIMPNVHLVITAASVIAFHEWICIVTVVYRLCHHFKGEQLHLMLPMVLGYALLMPSGILVGTGVSSGLGDISMALLMSLVGGALLFVSVIESLPRAFASSLSHSVLFCAFGAGVLLIALLVGISVGSSSHSHCAHKGNVTV